MVVPGYISRVKMWGAFQQTLLPPLLHNSSPPLETLKRTLNSTKMDFFSTVNSIFSASSEAGQQDFPVESESGGSGGNAYCVVA